ncbi:hypothetical protein [Pseudoxanthomonas sp. OG2]|uniref:hypothetical protein n=1 Tax=Pseudoxanthomonas sp. OG2 TaxID=2587011 RepID=UPI001622CFDD|nr:hypothetical protein [Pseudoxanthomonas sp. OG2]MBB3277354.1 hypothetical protein [Pseudoxanthomonas sp. OG2]
MPVSDPLDADLLRAFGRLEFKLKQRARFLRPNQRDAMVNWRAVNALVSALRREDFVDQVSDETRRKILTRSRDRPKVQEVVMVGALPKAEFRRRALDIQGQPPSDAIALVEAARRVRNNLFHGGKDDPNEQPFDDDDDEWALAAIDVAERLLALVDRNAFGPPEP